MHPTNQTIYRLADCGSDYSACHKIIRANGTPDNHPLNFPTVVAVRNKEIIGFLSTIKCNWTLLAGPLELKRPQPNGILMVRIAEAYENALRFMGVSRYCIHVNKPENPTWINQLERMGYQKILGTPERIFMERILTPAKLAA